MNLHTKLRLKWSNGFQRGKAQGVKAERVRIIKLLEESRERTNQRIQNEGLTDVDLAERIAVYKTLGNAIALIKGKAE